MIVILQDLFGRNHYCYCVFQKRPCKLRQKRPGKLVLIIYSNFIITERVLLSLPVQVICHLRIFSPSFPMHFMTKSRYSRSIYTRQYRCLPHTCINIGKISKSDKVRHLQILASRTEFAFYSVRNLATSLISFDPIVQFPTFNVGGVHSLYNHFQ